MLSFIVDSTVNLVLNNLPIPFSWPVTSATHKHSQEKERRGKSHAKSK